MREIVIDARHRGEADRHEAPFTVSPRATPVDAMPDIAGNAPCSLSYASATPSRWSNL